MELTEAQESYLASFNRRTKLVELSEAQEMSELLPSTKSCHTFPFGAQGTSRTEGSGTAERDEGPYSCNIDWSPMLQVIKTFTEQQKPPRRPRPPSVHESMVGRDERRRKHAKSRSASKGAKKNSVNGVERGSPARAAMAPDGGRSLVDLRVMMIRVKQLEVENRQLRERLEDCPDWRDLQDQITRVKHLEVENGELLKQLECVRNPREAHADATPSRGDTIAQRKQGVISNVAESISRTFSKRPQTRV